MIIIDGSHGEGGGQILRTSLTLSCITNEPVKISNIRANRPNPGLSAQHLTAARSLRKVCRGHLEGDTIGSKELIFHPGKVVPGNYTFNIGTAGSTILVAQTILPLLAMEKKKSRIRIIGGTYVMKSPSFDYFKYVFLRAIARFGYRGIESNMIKPGYYLRGGGIVDILINPSENRPVFSDDWTSYLEAAYIQISRLPLHIAIREKKIFVEHGLDNIYINDAEAEDVGNAVLYFNGFKGAYVLGEKGKRAEAVAKEAVDLVVKDSNFDVDRHLGDQLMIYGLIGNGLKYSCPKTNHLLSNTYVINEFIPNSVKLIGDKVLVHGIP